MTIPTSPSLQLWLSFWIEIPWNLNKPRMIYPSPPPWASFFHTQRWPQQNAAKRPTGTHHKNQVKSRPILSSSWFWVFSTFHNLTISYGCVLFCYNWGHRLKDNLVNIATSSAPRCCSVSNIIGNAAATMNLRCQLGSYSDDVLRMN